MLILNNLQSHTIIAASTAVLTALLSFRLPLRWSWSAFPAVVVGILVTGLLILLLVFCSRASLTMPMAGQFMGASDT